MGLRGEGRREGREVRCRDTALEAQFHSALGDWRPCGQSCFLCPEKWNKWGPWGWKGGWTFPGWTQTALSSVSREGKGVRVGKDRHRAPQASSGDLHCAYTAFFKSLLSSLNISISHMKKLRFWFTHSHQVGQGSS